MAFPFRRILCALDFDQSAGAVLDLAAKIALQNDSTVFMLHVVPMIIAPIGMPTYVDLYKGQEEAAHKRLEAFAHRYLSGVKYEIGTRMGEPISTILNAEKQLRADLLVTATHGRRGFSRVFLGSVAEAVLRESSIPVMAVRSGPSDQHLAGFWMTARPVIVSPGDKLATVQALMREGRFRSVPVIEKDELVGMITDRDIRQHAGDLAQVEVRTVMTREVLTVTPQTSIRDVARLLWERKIGGMPVIDDTHVVGMVTTSDVMRAFTEIE